MERPSPIRHSLPLIVEEAVQGAGNFAWQDIPVGTLQPHPTREPAPAREEPVLGHPVGHRLRREVIRSGSEETVTAPIVRLELHLLTR